MNAVQNICILSEYESRIEDMLCIKVHDNEPDRKWTKHINVPYSVNWPNYLFITWVHYLSTDNMFSYKNINVRNDLFVMNFNSIVPFMSVNAKLEEKARPLRKLSCRVVNCIRFLYISRVRVISVCQPYGK